MGRGGNKWHLCCEVQSDVVLNPVLPFIVLSQRSLRDLKLKQGHARAGDAVPTLTERKMRRYFVIIAMEIAADRVKIPRNRRCSQSSSSFHTRSLD